MSVQDHRGANLRVLAVSFVASTAVMTALSALPDMVTASTGEGACTEAPSGTRSVPTFAMASSRMTPPYHQVPLKAPQLATSASRAVSSTLASNIFGRAYTTSSVMRCPGWLTEGR
ncbi:MAG TPA: hypothetical protein VHN80_29160 [Kineosporiaceae bacterium]|nr:hypothetical protein [Kineosporiaceae bacterium]